MKAIYEIEHSIRVRRINPVERSKKLPVKKVIERAQKSKKKERV